MSFFIRIAYLVVFMAGISLVLSAGVVLFNTLAIRRQAKAIKNRSMLRQGLMGYINGDIGARELKTAVSGRESLLVGLVAQLSDELGEPSHTKLIEVFELSGLQSLVRKELDMLARSRNWRKRQRAATMLPYIVGRQVVIPPLLHALEDRVMMVRFSAAHSLAAIKAVDAVVPILEHLLLPDEWPIERTIEIMREMGSEAVPALLSYLGQPDAKDACKVFAISALGLQRAGEAVPVILSHLSHPDKEIRIQCAKALGNIGASEALPDLVTALGDNAWEVRAAVARSLRAVQDERAINALVGTLGDPVWWVRYNSADSLAELGSSGITALKYALTHQDRFARDVSRLVLQERNILKSSQSTAVS
ncbi:MAG: HEAT repeat domain-containing protein [Chlorobiaceae bacterium]|nr:HEAT repeat domain-containing protein [Chlorobiaceae bacterium]